MGNITMTDIYSTEKYSPEFWQWYDRSYLQDPNITHYRYDDEKMWQAWKAATNHNNKFNGNSMPLQDVIKLLKDNK